MDKLMDGRTPEQIREHYEIEKELANRLRHGTAEERGFLYTTLYDELYRRVPHNPVLIRKESQKLNQQIVDKKLKFLGRFLDREISFAEIGSGDCALSLRVARFVKQVYAVDVSEEITKDIPAPENFQLIISNGTSISIPKESVNVAYSYQLMEHLHPDDACQQLRNIYETLVPGGLYVCITPNRLSGPHDISKYFDDVATGFHLKEYTIEELKVLFRKTGFSKVVLYAGGRGIYLRAPLIFAVTCERALKKLPKKLGKSLANTLPFRTILGVRLVGYKGSLKSADA